LLVSPSVVAHPNKINRLHSQAGRNGPLKSLNFFRLSQAGKPPMPMSFPDMRSLRATAEIWKFRPPEEGESEAEYRAALAEQPVSR